MINPKPIADYSADEAAQEITTLAGKGTRIDLLAGQLLILAVNAETKLNNNIDNQRTVQHRMRKLSKDLNQLLSDTHGKKTINRKDLDMIYQSNKI